MFLLFLSSYSISIIPSYLILFMFNGAMYTNFKISHIIFAYSALCFKSLGYLVITSSKYFFPKSST